ncbi:MAG: C_GCAxxG_C_C family protein [Bacteroidales bacterium]|nr:C_GCAxxG_C_C family protein [Bacteroidales bacterium]
MSASQSAKNYFLEGYNCSQSVVVAFSDQYGLDKNTALRLASGFGSGMNEGEFCGAVTGALMILGLRYGYINSEDPEAKAKIKEATEKFKYEFRKSFGSLKCKKLLNIDVTKDYGKKIAIEKELFRTQCPKFVETAARILEKIEHEE